MDIPRHSRYFVEFILNSDALDANHLVIENSLINQVGEKRSHNIRLLLQSVSRSKFSLATSGPAATELSGLTFNYGELNGDSSRVVGANQPPPPQNFPCDTSPCINEYITLEIRYTTPGPPITDVFLRSF